jgi:hypothetical protein
MARKITAPHRKNIKRIKRTSSIQKCIAEGLNFLKTGKKITRAKMMVLRAKKLTPPAKRIKLRPKLTAVPVPVMTFPSIHSAPVFPPAPVIFNTRPAKPMKTTALKTSSRIDLPLPAFGFIDVCFCVDSTGSMSSELEQVKSTIAAIIEKLESKVRTEGITLRFAVVSYKDHTDFPLV